MREAKTVKGHDMPCLGRLRKSLLPTTAWRRTAGAPRQHVGLLTAPAPHTSGCVCTATSAYRVAHAMLMLHFLDTIQNA